MAAAFVVMVDLARQLRQRALVDDRALIAIDRHLPTWIEQLSTQGVARQWLYQTVSDDSLLALWNLAIQTQQPCLGLELGAEVNSDAQGMLSYWIERNATLGDALQEFSRHHKLMNASEYWQVQMSADHQRDVCLRLVCPPAYPLMAQERALIALLAWARKQLNQRLEPLAWRVPWGSADRDKLAWLNAFSQARIEQDSSFGLVLSVELLSKALPKADDYLADVLAREAKSLIGQRPTSRSLTEPTIRQQVECLLAEDLPRFHRVESVASELALSRTSLYRRLKAEQCQFRQLLEAERRRCWQRWRHHLDACTLAEQLGFTDVSGLYKAQKRWQHNHNSTA